MIDSYEKYRQVAKYAGGYFEEQFLELIDRLEASEKEHDALRAKITRMEQQEPVGEIVAFGESLHEVSWNKGKLPPLGAKLCLLPGAQPASSIPGDVMRDAKRYRFLRAAKNIPISTEAARDPVVYDAAIDAAMLARAPEAKP